jgi:branched-chain amino acid transport system substrate-binding protein
MNYLEAVQASGTDDADAIVKALGGKKINDFFLRNGEVRAADGQQSVRAGPPGHS